MPDKLVDDSLGGLVLWILHQSRELSFAGLVIVGKEMSMQFTQLPIAVVSFSAAIPGSGVSALLFQGLHSLENLLLKIRSTEVWLMFEMLVELVRFWVFSESVNGRCGQARLRQCSQVFFRKTIGVVCVFQGVVIHSITMVKVDLMQLFGFSMICETQVVKRWMQCWM